MRRCRRVVWSLTPRYDPKHEEQFGLRVSLSPGTNGDRRGNRDNAARRGCIPYRDLPQIAEAVPDGTSAAIRLEYESRVRVLLSVLPLRRQLHPRPQLPPPFPPPRSPQYWTQQ